MSKYNRQALLKKLLYQSNYRGCKETDILIGEFSKVKINDYCDQKLELYQEFILEDDAFLYDWIMNRKVAPDRYQSMVDEIRLFHNL